MVMDIKKLEDDLKKLNIKSPDGKSSNNNTFELLAKQIVDLAKNKSAEKSIEQNSNSTQKLDGIKRIEDEDKDKNKKPEQEFGVISGTEKIGGQKPTVSEGGSKTRRNIAAPPPAAPPAAPPPLPPPPAATEASAPPPAPNAQTTEPTPSSEVPPAPEQKSSLNVKTKHFTKDSKRLLDLRKDRKFSEKLINIFKKSKDLVLKFQRIPNYEKYDLSREFNNINENLKFFRDNKLIKEEADPKKIAILDKKIRETQDKIKFTESKVFEFKGKNCVFQSLVKGNEKLYEHENINLLYNLELKFYENMLKYERVNNQIHLVFANGLKKDFKEKLREIRSIDVKLNLPVLVFKKDDNYRHIPYYDDEGKNSFITKLTGKGWTLVTDKLNKSELDQNSNFKFYASKEGEDKVVSVSAPNFEAAKTKFEAWMTKDGADLGYTASQKSTTDFNSVERHKDVKALKDDLVSLNKEITSLYREYFPN